MSPEPFTPPPPAPPLGHDSERDPFVGALLDDRYFIDSVIASGGFGAVYRAHQRSGEPVAIKILHPHMTSDQRMVVRFRREGATMVQLHDPHTVKVCEVGETSDGTLYIVMELLRGESVFDRLLRLGAIPWREAVAIARAVCSSLAEAHALGVIHRDLKPANIHIDQTGKVKVIDFGIAKIMRGSSIDDGLELTFAGHMIGTYDYMSPEQIVGGTCVAQSDIFSLGVVLYEMLTGRRPFEDDVDNPAKMMAALLSRTPDPPSRVVEIPPELDRIVMRCLARDIADRPANIAELATAFEALVVSDPAHEAETVIRPALLATELETANERPLPIRPSMPPSVAPSMAPEDPTVPTPKLPPTVSEESAAADAETVLVRPIERAIERPSERTIRHIVERAVERSADPADEPTVRPRPIGETVPLRKSWRKRPITLQGTPAPRLRTPRGTPAIPLPPEQRYPVVPAEWREPQFEPPAPLPQFPSGTAADCPVLRPSRLSWLIALAIVLVAIAVAAAIAIY